ncbi:MAG: tRNA uracil 4-sulfurtransferase ThiI [Candidatus Arsenophonus melophagi]|nr:tRNA uracil 4-sulfurtransferase ThiI [Candidatus Arsenophonus melophagi]
MKCIIKLFPEIIIKSQSVRLRFIKILATNISNILHALDMEIKVTRHWDNIVVSAKKNTAYHAICDALIRIPGIHHILLVEEYQFHDINHIFELIYPTYAGLLINKTFCVRVKRLGKHTFSSMEIERYIGKRFDQNVLSAKVKLNQPDVIINLVIEHDKVMLVKARIEGIGGFPIGTQGDVLSLLSGGFDSGVSSYMLMRRGCRVHYCFFNLGGISHEIGVRNLAYYLWYRFGRSHKVRFVAIDFSSIVSEILENMDNSYVGVILKRMMVRTASIIAERYGIQALVTGEALGQVSSQTLTNLRLIDNVTDSIILRPLISYDKENIINIARKIGTEVFANTMPEYCGLISKKPTLKAIKETIIEQESKFDFSLLNRVLSKATIIDIHNIMNDHQQKIATVEVVNSFSVDDIILDIRPHDAQKARPLNLSGVNVKLLPFYKLNSQFSQLPQQKLYLLYCESGVMGHLQALYLYEKGFKNVKVYQP